VFALEAVQVNLTGQPPMRLPKGGHIKIKSDTGFGTIGISRLHPVLSEDAYGQLLRTQQRKEIGSLTVCNLRALPDRALTGAAGSLSQRDVPPGRV